MNINDLLKTAKEKGASDIHIIPDAPIFLRINRELVKLTSNNCTPNQAKELCYSLLTEDQTLELENSLDLDLTIDDEQYDRYRINICYCKGKISGVIRLLPKNPIPLEQIKLPKFVSKIPDLNKGLILITGSTSQGKTTTMASIIEEINQKKSKNIITIEDPIEYSFESKNSIIRQREVGKDTKSFLTGLRSALRQDPDVIVIGEMRDYETIKIAMTAAETGILVLSTLHIISIDKIIERLLSYAPDGSGNHVRALLAESLVCIIHQELLPALDDNKIVASELLIANPAVRHIIKNRDGFHLRNILQMGKGLGMQTMKHSLDKLFHDHIISKSTYENTLKNYVI